MAVAANQKPIIIPLYLGGATLDTKDIPIGESSSAANVRTKYVDIKLVGATNVGLTVPPSSFGDISPSEANVMIRKPQAATNIPIPIFLGADGSLPFLPKKPNMAIDTGVRATTKNGLNCWNCRRRRWIYASILLY